MYYDGYLLTGESWSGPINGSVSRAYDNNFRITALSINGTPLADFLYDQDGLLIEAGDLATERDPQSGFAIGTVLGKVTDTRSHTLFREMEDYTADYDGTVIFNTQCGYGKLGRIVERTETVGG